MRWHCTFTFTLSLSHFNFHTLTNLNNLEFESLWGEVVLSLSHFRFHTFAFSLSHFHFHTYTNLNNLEFEGLWGEVVVDGEINVSAPLATSTLPLIWFKWNEILIFQMHFRSRLTTMFKFQVSPPPPSPWFDSDGMKSFEMPPDDLFIFQMHFRSRLRMWLSAKSTNPCSSLMWM